MVDDPVVVGANRYRFAPGQRILNTDVRSVSFIWVTGGTGIIIAGGREFAVAAQHVVRLPWRHTVEYRADGRTPFDVGTLHVVPSHARDAPVVPRVAHLPGDELLDDPARSGDAVAFRPGISTLRDTAARRIVEFGTVAIERLAERGFEESYFRALGRLIADENASWGAGSASAMLPVPLEQMMLFVRQHLDEPLSVTRVAASVRCSETTAQRLFRQYAGESVQAWIRQVRLKEAATLLRTTGARVGEVARRVGYTDPLYFSRAFRSAYGVSPSRYAGITVLP